MTKNVADTQFGMQGRSTGPETSTYYAQHDFDGPAKLSTTVIHAVSEVANADMTTTESTVFQQVDLKALDDLFSPVGPEAPRTSGHVSLDVWGYGVTIYSNGQIVIAAPQHRH